MHSFDRSVVKPTEGGTLFAVGCVPVSSTILLCISLSKPLRM
jgi:hypothetical protein